MVDRPLTGVVVVEAASYLTGPLAAKILGDLGADVVKVEPPSGDPFRRFGHIRDGIGAQFLNAHGGKRSIYADLKDPVGRDHVQSLLDGADVFIQNWRPGVAASLGLDADTIRARNPRLVAMSITGYGDDGPRASAPAFDALIQAATGVTDLVRRYGRPDVLGTWLADKVTAFTAVQAILSALVRRATTDDGCTISLPMLDAVAYFNFPDLFEHRTFLDDDSELELPVSTVMRTSDGFVAVAPVSGAQIGRAVAAVGHPEWKELLKTAGGGRALAARMVALLEQATTSLSTADVLARFEAADVPASPVLTRDEHLNDPQVLHNEIYGQTTTDGHVVRTARFPARFDGVRLRAGG